MSSTDTDTSTTFRLDSYAGFTLSLAVTRDICDTRGQVHANGAAVDGNMLDGERLVAAVFACKP
jgi:hypothetical protein